MTTAPVLDEDALVRLGEQLGDAGVLCDFARAYASSLDARLRRLHGALLARDLAGWTDAVLSLRSASEMAGAAALAQFAGALQAEVSARPTDAVHWPDEERVAGILAVLGTLAAETERHLGRFVDRLVGAAPSAS